MFSPVIMKLFVSVEAFWMFFKRFAYPCRYHYIMYRFAWPVPQLCMISSDVLDFYFNNWGHLLRTFQLNWLSQQHIEHFTNIVYGTGVPLDNCWSFLDGKVRAISRLNIHQRVLYNGHKRYNTFQFHSVVALNGLIANLYGSAENKRQTVACS